MEMKKEQKQAIIESGKQYFRSIIIPNHGSTDIVRG